MLFHKVTEENIDIFLFRDFFVQDYIIGQWVICQEYHIRIIPVEDLVHWVHEV